MDTLAKLVKLQLAAKNAIRMIEGWSHDPDTADALLEMIREEIERGLGATVEPPELTPEAKREAKEFLDDLFLGCKA